jgi:hypothetical protein
MVGARALTFFFINSSFFLLFGIGGWHQLIILFFLSLFFLFLSGNDAFENDFQKVLPPETGILLKYRLEKFHVYSIACHSATEEVFQ